MRWGRKVWALSVQKMRSSPDSGTLFQVSNVLFHIPRHSLLTSINQTVSIFRRFCRSHRFCCWPLSGQVTAGDQIRNLNFWIPNTSRWIFWQIPLAHGPKQSLGSLIATYCTLTTEHNCLLPQEDLNVLFNRAQELLEIRDPTNHDSAFLPHRPLPEKYRHNITI